MYDSSRVFALLATVALLLASVLPVNALAADGTLTDFKAVQGSIEVTPSGLLLKPDSSGKIYLTLTVPELDLSRHQILHIKTGSQAPLSHFLLWQTVEQGEQVFQYNIPPAATAQGSVVLDMSGRPYWEGRATMIGLGLVVPGGKPVLLSEFRFYQPGLAYDASLFLKEWTGYLPWQLSDSNFYTGTSGYGKGIRPVPLAACLMAVLLAACLLFQLLISRRTGVNWRALGAAVFISWLLIDALWQYRLVERARVTLATYAGKSPLERLMTTADAPVLQLVGDIRPLIKGQSPRVYIVSRSDYYAVLGSYYLSPLNTLLDSGEREAKTLALLRPGDYVLFIRPSLVHFDAQRGILRTNMGSREIAVESLYSSPAGQLLRLI